MSALTSSFARLSAASTLLALAFSRISLVAHEFVGHGGPAVLLGGTISDYRLYLFAGGRIHYSRPEPYSFAEQLFISTGGIAIELVLAGLAIWAARRARPGSLLRVGLLAYAVGNAVHATYYMAVGIHYEIADGAMLHRLLGPGPARASVVVALTLLTGVAAYLGARALVSQLWPQVAASARPRLAVFGAIIVALAIHGGLTVLSLKVEADRSYAQVMRSKAERRAERAAARARVVWVERGEAVDAARLEALRTRVYQRERPFPLRLVLFAVIALAGLLGARSRRELSDPADPWTWAGVARLAGITAISVLVVWLLRAPSW